MYVERKWPNFNFDVIYNTILSLPKITALSALSLLTDHAYLNWFTCFLVAVTLSQICFYNLHRPFLPFFVLIFWYSHSRCHLSLLKLQEYLVLSANSEVIELIASKVAAFPSYLFPTAIEILMFSSLSTFTFAKLASTLLCSCNPSLHNPMEG